MTPYTTAMSPPPAHATSGSARVDVQRLGPMALAMNIRTARRGPYIPPTEREYFAY